MSDLVNMDALDAVSVFVDGAIEKVVASVKYEIDQFQPDMTTQEGRDAINVFARKIRKSEIGLDKMGKDFTAEAKRQTKKIDTQRKQMRDTLEAMRTEFRAELTAYELLHSLANEMMAQLSVIHLELNTTAEINERIFQVQDLKKEDWGSRREEILVECEEALERLNDKLAASIEREAEQRELEMYRQQKQEAEKVARDEAIAQKAVEQEKARQAADKERQEAIQAAKLANRDHLATVNNSIANNLIERGITFSIAQGIVKDMASGRIEHVTIIY